MRIILLFIFLTRLPSFAKALNEYNDFKLSNDKRSIQKIIGSSVVKEFAVITVCGKPFVGKAEIRFFKKETNKIFIVYGKHNFAEINILTDQLICLGAE